MSAVSVLLLVTVLVAMAAVGATLVAVNIRLAKLVRSSALRGGLEASPASFPFGLIRCLSHNIEAMTLELANFSHRKTRRHAVTDMPTREILIEAVDATDPAGDYEIGMLGVIELLDFDQLAAFDSDHADYVLRIIADRIERMVGKHRIVAQIDRARFGIWLGGATKDTAETEVQALCYALGSRISAPGIDLLPQLASGWSYRAEKTALTSSQMIAQAQIASGSPSGVDAIQSDRRDPAASAKNRFALEQDLRHAIERDQFTLQFQPFVNAAQQRVYGAEALIRWHHPVNGMISPTAFIPVVESAGMSEEVGMWVMNAACEAARQWQNEGLSNVRVAVNVSAHQLVRDDLDIVVDRMLQRHRLAPARLELELTETVAAVDSDSAARLFDRVRALGVSIAIDDFGAGYSSLSYLKKLRFDKLKIDREFVTEVDRHRDSQAICQSIIALARGLGIAVLAEGVERYEEYAWLRQHGCILFQGYYLSRPLDSAAFLDFAHDDAAIKALTALGPAVLQKRIVGAVA